jgi:hypothetical protein
MVEPLPRSERVTSSPSTPGNMRSRMMRSGAYSWAVAIAATPSPTFMTPAGVLELQFH